MRYMPTSILCSPTEISVPTLCAQAVPACGDMPHTGKIYSDGWSDGCCVRCSGGGYARVPLLVLARLLADCEAHMPSPLVLPLACPTTAVLATRCKEGTSPPAAAASRKAHIELLNSPLLRAKHEGTLLSHTSCFQCQCKASEIM